jgi:hypothetical protein
LFSPGTGENINQPKKQAIAKFLADFKIDLARFKDIKVE